jgi:hypothetical protein
MDHRVKPGDDGWVLRSREGALRTHANFNIFKQPKKRHCEPTGRANARPMTGSAKQAIKQQERKGGLLRRFAPRNDVAQISDTPSPSRRSAPELCMHLSPKEGVGNAGCPQHPQPRVHFVLVERTRSKGVSTGQANKKILQTGLDC